MWYLCMFFFMVASSLLASTLEDALTQLRQLDPQQFSRIENLEQFKQLSEIRLVGVDMTEKDFEIIAPLCHMNSIKSLEFQGVGISGQELQSFSKECGTWRSIKTLRIPNNPLKDNELEVLNIFPNLESLDIDFLGEKGASQVTGRFLKTLSLPKLYRLDATSTNLSDENAALLLAWDQFKEFRLWDTAISCDLMISLESKKINRSATSWDLKRLKYELAHPQYVVLAYPQTTWEENLKVLDWALKNRRLNYEAYDWAKNNRIVIKYYDHFPAWAFDFEKIRS